MKSRSLMPLVSSVLLSLVTARMALALPNAEPSAPAVQPAAPASEPKPADPELDTDTVGSELDTDAVGSTTEPTDPETTPILEPPLPDPQPALTKAERKKARREEAERRRTERAEARREKAERKRARRERAAPGHHIPLRIGAGAFAGGTIPNTAPALGFALRAGLQRTRVSFMLEGGLSGAIGGALSSGDQHSSRATLFYHGYLAPTAELNLEPLFVSLGVPLGIGMWSSTSNTVEPSGTVTAEARSTVGLISFVGGVDLRLGRHFTLRGRHHLTCAFGTKVLFARQDAAKTVIPLNGAIEGTSDRSVGVRFVPTLTVGYDFF